MSDYYVPGTVLSSGGSRSKTDLLADLGMLII